jgi:hypothetical protein
VKVDFLTKVTEREVRQAILTALIEIRSHEKGRASFDYHNVIVRVGRLLLESEQAALAAKSWHEYQPGYRSDPGGREDEHPDNRKLLSAMWTLIGEGVLFPRLKSHTRDGYPLLIDRVGLTARGERLLAGGDEHPLHPGFIARFQSRAPKISDEVTSRMEDAVSCVEKALLRAALVMIGLAAEETLRVTHAAMVNLAHIGKSAPATKNAKDVLEDIHKALASWPTVNDEQHRLTKAMAAAESIRTERNRASHPGVVVDDAPAVEELLVLAARQIPIFWEIPIDHAVKSNGFVL